MGARIDGLQREIGENPKVQLRLANCLRYRWHHGIAFPRNGTCHGAHSRAESREG
jgi:hypothetical protein